MVFRKVAFLILAVVFVLQGALAVADPASELAASDLLRLGEHRGVSLTDISDPKNGVSELAPAARLALAELSSAAAVGSGAALSEVRSISVYKVESGVLTVDVFGHDKRFAVVTKGKKGLGFVRVEILFEGSGEALRVTGHRIALQRDYSELSPRVRVSLIDRLAVLFDKGTGFFRVFPLGVGSIDTVHFNGVTTIMTPATEWSRLDKRHLWEKRSKPKYFRGKPFINLNVPLEIPQENKTVAYRTSEIAFHIWQKPGFQRGFLSHGCMRMRDEDLNELLSAVQGVKETVPVVIRAAKIRGVSHPYPFLNDKYNAVKNFGTASRPKAKKVADNQGVFLTATQGMKGAPPLDKIEGTSMDPAVVGPSPGEALEEW